MTTENPTPEPAPRPLRAAAAGGALWAMLQGAASQIISLAAFVVIARLSEPRYFGLVAVGLSLVEGLRLAFVEMWAIAVLADRTADRKDWSAAFWATLCSCLALFALLFGLAPLIAAPFHEPELANVIRSLSFILVFYGLGRVPEAWLLRRLDFRALAGRTAIAAALGGAVGVAAAVSGAGVEALILQQLIGAAASCAFLWLAAGWRPLFPVTLARLKTQMAFAVKLTPSSIAYFLSQNLDVLILTFVAGAGASGVYTGAKRVRLAALIVFSGLSQVALSSFSGLRDEPQRLARAVISACSITMLLIGPAFVGAACLAPELVSLLFGPKWSAAAPVLSILLLSGPLFILNDYFEQLLIVCRRPLWLAGLKAAFIAALAAAIAAASRWGAPAVAGASVAVSAAILPATIFAASRAAPVTYLAAARALAAPALGCAAMAALIALCRPALGAWPSSMRFLALGLLGAGLYAGVLYLTARASLQRLLETIESVLGRRLRPGAFGESAPS